MSKRRVFDIDFPEDGPVQEPVATSTDKPNLRRGPMATAITETAEALRSRATTERAIREENDRLAHELVRLKRDGLVTDLIPIGEVRTAKLVRDRSTNTDPDLQELKVSIRDIGLSNPIRVELTKQGYELIQGFRRLSAYRELFAETGDERFACIPAGIVSGDEMLATLYRRMVDENLVRKDLSFAEMAQLARGSVADGAAGFDSIDEAIKGLYASAGRQKRSYIRHFVTLLDAIGEVLRFPEAISRKLGLDLVKQIEADQSLSGRLAMALAAQPASTPEDEVMVLREAMRESVEDTAFLNEDHTARASSKPRGGKNPQAKTTLSCTVPGGTVRCAAREGRVELSMDRDFSRVDRKRLEAAITAFVEVLGD